MLLLSVTACGNIKGNSYCLIASPINPTENDISIISDSLVDDLLLHNEIYDRLCE